MIDFQHPNYINSIQQWQLIDDICEAKNLKQYIVKINSHDGSQSAQQRRDQFFKRSVFYAIAGYTAQGFLGKAFSEPPKCTVPDSLDYVRYDIDGAGVSIYQQAQEVFKDVVRIGRAGLLIDFPTVEGDVSRQDMVDNQTVATVTRFSADQIVNWQVRKIGSKVKPVLIVLKSTENELHYDGFGFDVIDIYIELRLDDDGYYQREWRKHDLTGEHYIHSESTPVDSKGQRLTMIPFIFVGSEANTSRVDFAPMYDLSKINVGHFNNSAIYEDSVFVVGQVQPWMSGLSGDTLDDLRKNGQFIGSGTLMGVPSGERFDFAQAKPNSLAKEAMTDKVQMMIGLGAMFLSPNGVAKTATQVDGELMAQHSVLSLISSNVSEAYNQALGYVKLFMGGDDEEATLLINRQFVKPNASAQDITAMVASFLQGALPISDLLNWQKLHGLVDKDKTLEDYSEEIGIQDSMADLDEEI
mgnify:FL=1